MRVSQRPFGSHWLAAALAVWLLTPCPALAQPPATLTSRLDSLVRTSTVRPFHGLILVTQSGKVLYYTTRGLADSAARRPFTRDTQFVIGSVSKQITATLVLREMDRGRLRLTDPIGRYLPTLRLPWADSVTIHQLLNHTSGIVGTRQPLAFKPGSQFAYSGLGYALLGKIVERTTGKPFAAAARALFEQCGMAHSTAPNGEVRGLATGYVRQSGGRVVAQRPETSDSLAPAGLLISTANDLTRWNEHLHGGKLLKPATYQLMTTASATRPHPVWGTVGYGYGLQRSQTDPPLEIGHSGYAAGFVTLNQYYPATRTSVLALENLDWNEDTFIKTFYFESQLLKIARQDPLISPL